MFIIGGILIGEGAAPLSPPPGYAYGAIALIVKNKTYLNL